MVITAELCMCSQPEQSFDLMVVDVTVISRLEVDAVLACLALFLDFICLAVFCFSPCV